MNSEQLPITQNVLLAPYTTIGLGGEADYFCSCISVQEIRDALEYAASKKMRVHILSGGSNTIFSDNGFRGLVLKIDLKGISFVEDGNDILVSVKAGEDWEKFAALSVEKGLGGVECLSGIPGSVGATPIQNVGAYGQEVKDTIEYVKAVDRKTLEEKEFRNIDCGFGYRMSRFKGDDAGSYIVTEVTFRLKKNGRPTIHYPEVKKVIDSQVNLASLADGKESLSAVRDIVLSLRKKKSMVINPNDPNTRSVGSFFMNPIVTGHEADEIRNRWESAGDGTPIPMFASEGKTKIPAAWLIEKSGFKKGYTTNNVGISEHHTLALINRGGTTADLLLLAEEIRAGVQKQFGVRLEFEANVIS